MKEDKLPLPNAMSVAKNARTSALCAKILTGMILATGFLFSGLEEAKAQSSIIQVTNNHLINQINLTTGVSTAIYTGSGTAGYNAAGFNSTNGLLYFVDLNNQTLNAYNPATPTTAPYAVGTLPTGA